MDDIECCKRPYTPEGEKQESEREFRLTNTLKQGGTSMKSFLYAVNFRSNISGK